MLLAIFISVFAFLLNNFVMERKILRQQKLMGELLILRGGVRLFSEVNERGPRDLTELCVSKFRLTGASRNTPYVDIRLVDINDQGKILDPFGNPFSYNPQTMWVASTTPGFKSW